MIMIGIVLVAMLLLGAALPAGMQNGLTATFRSGDETVTMLAPGPFLERKGFAAGHGNRQCDPTTLKCLPFVPSDFAAFSVDDYNVTFSGQILANDTESQLIVEYSKHACVSILINGSSVLDECGFNIVYSALEQYRRVIESDTSVFADQTRADLDAFDELEIVRRRVSFLENMDVEYVPFEISYSYATGVVYESPYLNVDFASYTDLAAGFSHITASTLREGDTDIFITPVGVESSIPQAQVDALQQLAPTVEEPSQPFLCFSNLITCGYNGSWYASALFIPLTDATTIMIPEALGELQTLVYNHDPDIPRNVSLLVETIMTNLTILEFVGDIMADTNASTLFPALETMDVIMSNSIVDAFFENTLPLTDLRVKIEPSVCEVDFTSLTSLRFLRLYETIVPGTCTSTVIQSPLQIETIECKSCLLSGFDFGPHELTSLAYVDFQGSVFSDNVIIVPSTVLDVNIDGSIFSDTFIDFVSNSTDVVISDLSVSGSNGVVALFRLGSNVQSFTLQSSNIIGGIDFSYDDIGANCESITISSSSFFQSNSGSLTFPYNVQTITFQHSKVAAAIEQFTFEPYVDLYEIAFIDTDIDGRSNSIGFDFESIVMPSGLQILRLIDMDAYARAEFDPQPDPSIDTLLYSAFRLPTSLGTISLNQMDIVNVTFACEFGSCDFEVQMATMNFTAVSTNLGTVSLMNAATLQYMDCSSSRIGSFVLPDFGLSSQWPSALMHINLSYLDVDTPLNFDLALPPLETLSILGDMKIKRSIESLIVLPQSLRTFEIGPAFSDAMPPLRFQSYNDTHGFLQRFVVVSDSYKSASWNLYEGVEHIELYLSRIRTLLFENTVTTVTTLIIDVQYEDALIDYLNGDTIPAVVNFRALIGPSLEYFELSCSDLLGFGPGNTALTDSFQLNNATSLQTLVLRDMFLPLYSLQNTWIVPSNVTRLDIVRCQYPTTAFPLVFAAPEEYLNDMVITITDVEEADPPITSNSPPYITTSAPLPLPSSLVTIVVDDETLINRFDFSTATSLVNLTTSPTASTVYRGLVTLHHLSMRNTDPLPYTAVEALVSGNDGLLTLSLTDCWIYGVEPSTESAVTTTLGTPPTLSEFTMSGGRLHVNVDFAHTSLNSVTLESIAGADEQTLNLNPGLLYLELESSVPLLDLSILESLTFLYAQGGAYPGFDSLQSIQLPPSLQVLCVPRNGDVGYFPTDNNEEYIPRYYNSLEGFIDDAFVFRFSNLFILDLNSNQLRTYDISVGLDVADIPQTLLVPRQFDYMGSRLLYGDLTNNPMEGYLPTLSTSLYLFDVKDKIWCADDLLGDEATHFCTCTEVNPGPICRLTTCGLDCRNVKVLRQSPSFVRAAEANTIAEFDVYLKPNTCINATVEDNDVSFDCKDNIVCSNQIHAQENCSTIDDPVLSFSFNLSTIDFNKDLNGFHSYPAYLHYGSGSSTLLYMLTSDRYDVVFIERYIVYIYSALEGGCLPGKRFHRLNSTCSVCDAGTVSLGREAATCSPCHAGEYQDEAEQSECIPCHAGTFSNTTGSTICEPCHVGTYQPFVGQTVCLLCSEGHYQNQTGQQTCETCVAGSYQSLEGQEFCTLCERGKAQSSPEATSCTACSAGFAMNETGAEDCDVCQPGTFAASDGAFTCTPCGRGEEQPAGAATACTRCEAGFATNATGTPSCGECEPGTYASMTGSFVCEPCDPGSFADRAGTVVCSICDAGKYNPVIGATEAADCLNCPAGRYGNATGLDSINACTKCPLGTFGILPGANQESLCDPCPTGRYSDTLGQNQCTPCSRGRFSNATGATTAATCVACPSGSFNSVLGNDACSTCSPGTFSNTTAANSSVVCSVCPSSVVCTAGASEWFVKPGYFRNPLNKFDIVECIPQEACLATGTSSSTTCSPGYTGNLCGSCIEYEYYRAGQQCHKCGSQAIKWVLLVVCFLLAMTVFYFILQAKGSRMTKYGIRSIITSVQILAVYPKLSQDWDSSMLDFFNVLSVSNFNIELFSPECSYPLDYFSRWKAMQLVPIVMGVSLAVVYLTASRIQRTPLKLNAILGALLYLLVTIYTYLISNALEPYNCIAQPDGTYMMAFNPGTLCFRGAWNDNQVYFAMAAAVYCVVFPVLLLIAFYNYNNYEARELESFQQLFGILSHPFHDRFFFWELVHTLEKVAIVSSADIFSTIFSNQSIKIFTVMALIFVFHMLGSVLRPYRIDARNNTESMWSMIRVFFLMSTFVYASTDMSDNDKQVFTILLVSIFSVFLAYTIGSICLHCRSKKSSDHQRLHRDLHSIVDNLFHCLPQAIRTDIARRLTGIPRHFLKLWVATTMENKPGKVLRASTTVDVDDSVTEPRPKMKRVHKPAPSPMEDTAWRTVMTEDGTPYYYNANTMETTWHNPFTSIMTFGKKSSNSSSSGPKVHDVIPVAASAPTVANSKPKAKVKAKPKPPPLSAEELQRISAVQELKRAETNGDPIPLLEPGRGLTPSPPRPRGRDMAKRKSVIEIRKQYE